LWARRCSRNEKERALAHSFFFGSSCEPDEDDADIIALLLAGKDFLALVEEDRKPPVPLRRHEK
jgi:hypothetical protein